MPGLVGRNYQNHLERISL